ncbi:MAG: TetR/AcrR family transcriptional regulator [Bradyrhizobium sp.]|uniref:TetR/AcrR family transcriptional regulator n=1 Tax=Bradyrhizobium sp. TaxID=376 RepID=UPI003D1423A2
MPRPREFEEDAVLDAAVECFWRRGLEATSVRDLSEATGLSQPSLYNAFGDKRQLFARSLERYAAQSMRARIERIEETHAPADAIRVFFGDLITRSLADTDRRGCLIVNTALEVAPHDAAMRRTIGAYLAEIEGFFLRSLERLRDEGALASGHDARDLARHFLGLLLGLRVAARARPQRELLEGMLRPALMLLGPADNRGGGINRHS